MDPEPGVSDRERERGRERDSKLMSNGKQMHLLRGVSKLKHGLFPKGIISTSLSAGINQITTSEAPSPLTAFRAALLISHIRLGVQNTLFILRTAVLSVQKLVKKNIAVLFSVAQYCIFVFIYFFLKFYYVTVFSSVDANDIYS